ncbi:MAG: HprK-related kinase A [Burkholderiales bacterium]|nr:HprK-related kinase A [Burkholderiales bacterium]
MQLSELATAEIVERIRGPGLAIRTGPFCFRVVSRFESVARAVQEMYAEYPLAADGDFADFTVELQPGAGIRRWFRRQVRFRWEGMYPFEPLPAEQAYPLLEWALNWCIAGYGHQFLMLHAAVIERAGKALIMPAPPGSGKSTLCAALIHRGWRLLSDELALISPEDRLISPLGRPVSLKNRSLEVIRQFVPGVVLTAATRDTAKGTVAHMRVPTDQVRALGVRAPAAWVVFPRYQAGMPATLVPRSKADSMFELGRNAFNYTLMGLTGFEVLADVVSACDCYDFSYGDLDEAVDVFARLADGASA